MSYDTIEFNLYPNPATISLSELEKTSCELVDSVFKGISIAPNLSPLSPCFFILSYKFHIMFRYLERLAERRSMTTPAILRLEHGKLLDAMLSFAGSTWTPKQRRKYLSCPCPIHRASHPALDSFRETFHTDARGYASHFDPLHDIVLLVFATLTLAINDILISEKDVIKQEKTSKKRSRWPTSPSQFIPRGAPATVAAFISWAKLIENPMPLGALVQLTRCCPSLEPAMAENKDLLPLLSSLLFQITKFIQRLKPEEYTAVRIEALQSDIVSYRTFFNETWIRIPLAAASNDKTITSNLISIYRGICDLIPLVDRCFLPGIETKTSKQSLGAVAVMIHRALVDAPTSTTKFPLDPVLTSYASPVDPDTAAISLANEIVNLRNQPKCTLLTCPVTAESIKSNFKLCSGCHAVRYCSRDCQKSDWKDHKVVCKSLGMVLPIAFSCRCMNPSEEEEVVALKFQIELLGTGLSLKEITTMGVYVLTHTRRMTDAVLPTNGDFWTQEQIRESVSNHPPSSAALEKALSMLSV